MRPIQLNCTQNKWARMNLTKLNQYQMIFIYNQQKLSQANKMTLLTHAYVYDKYKVCGIGEGEKLLRICTQKKKKKKNGSQTNCEKQNYKNDNIYINDLFRIREGSVWARMHYIICIAGYYVKLNVPVEMICDAYTRIVSYCR